MQSDYNGFSGRSQMDLELGMPQSDAREHEAASQLYQKHIP